MPGSDIKGGHVMPALNLDPEVVRQARELAAVAGQPIVEMARTRTPRCRWSVRCCGLAASTAPIRGTVCHG